MEVSCLGYVSLLKNIEIYDFVGDNRVDRWGTVSEVPKGLYRPDLFNVSSGDGLVSIAPNATDDESGRSNEYTDIVYSSEIDIERFDFDYSVSFRGGRIFEANIVSFPSSTEFVYDDSVNNQVLRVGMEIFNTVEGSSVIVVAHDSGTKTVEVSEDISTWNTTDEVISGSSPFSGEVLLSTGNTVITYSQDIGEDNLASGDLIVNTTKREMATIDTVNTSTNMITFTKNVSWTYQDVIFKTTPLFSMLINGSVSGTNVPYDTEIGVDVVSSDAGWIIYNQTRDDFCAVASWSAGSFDATLSGDVSSWANNDQLVGYQPYKVQILNDGGSVIWPNSNETSKLQESDSVSLTSLSTRSITIRYQNYIKGSGTDENFFAFSPKVYTVNSGSTQEEVFKYLMKYFNADFDTSTSDIGSFTKILLPTVYEFEDLLSVFAEAASTFEETTFNELLWGLNLDDKNTLFLKLKPDIIDYQVDNSSLTVKIEEDLDDSLQKITPYYREDETLVFQTPITDSTYSFQNEEFYEVQYPDYLGTAQAYFDAKSNPVPKSSVKVTGDVFDTSGNKVPFDEIQAKGGFLKIRNLRSSEVTLEGLDVQPIKAVEVDLESGTTNIILKDSISDFEKFMAEISRLSNE